MMFTARRKTGIFERCIAKARTLPSTITVTFHKEIEPTRVKEVLREAHIFVLPSKSENFGHAIYEALSAGRPVITSNNTPWNNLEESHAGMNVSIENNVELTAAIDFFASMDEATLLQWQQGAISYAGKAIDTEKILEQYRKMFMSSLPSSPERAGVRID